MQSRKSIIRLVSSLGVEFTILFLCVGIFLQVGKTKGPVFDSIGPDVIPQSLAIVVILLVLTQMFSSVSGFFSSGFQKAEADFVPPNVKGFIFFILATMIFVLTLRFWVAPLVFLTPLYIVVATLIFAYEFERRIIVGGCIVGVVLGLLQYIVFTNFIHVDLFISF